MADQLDGDKLEGTVSQFSVGAGQLVGWENAAAATGRVTTPERRSSVITVSGRSSVGNDRETVRETLRQAGVVHEKSISAQ